MRSLAFKIVLLLAYGACIFATPIFSLAAGGTGLIGNGGQNERPRGGGPGGPGGPNAPDRSLVKEFDLDKDGRLNKAERADARKAIQNDNRGRSRRRGPRFGARGRPAGKPGAKVDSEDVAVYPQKPLYDPEIVRTLFLEFENDDWEKELADFKPTDVEVPAKLTVDGKEYSEIGVGFRGASSYFMIPSGLKRSLNLSIDFANKSQRLYGYKTLNLLNCNGDAGMMSSALYSFISGSRIATPKVNFVKVVINGESWGLYCNVQQFNKEFIQENFGTTKGARWKVSGSPRGDGGLRYLGEEIEPYRERFEIKSKDIEESWRALIELCRVLNETPTDKLEEALDPLLDIDTALWFLAVDVALINSDGYWTRASDYSIYLDPKGKFHILPHDMNEAFRGARRRRGGPPGFGGPPPRGGPPNQQGRNERRPEQRPEGATRPSSDGNTDNTRKENPRPNEPPRSRGGQRGQDGIGLDPLVGVDDPGKPLRSNLLANQNLRTRYLQHVRTIANDLLNWEKLGPRIANTRKLLSKEVAADTRKLMTTDAFLAATSPDGIAKNGQASNLRGFIEMRAAYLLDHEAIKKLPKKLVPLLQDSTQPSRSPRPDVTDKKRN